MSQERGSRCGIRDVEGRLFTRLRVAIGSIPTVLGEQSTVLGEQSIRRYFSIQFFPRQPLKCLPVLCGGGFDDVRR